MKLGLTYRVHTCIQMCILTKFYIAIDLSFFSHFSVLTIEGEASVLDYQEILRNVTFFIDSKEPDSSDRIVCFTIFDGIHNSPPACLKLKVLLLNDNEPVFNATALGEAYVEGSDGVRLLTSLNITDDDDPALFLMQGARVSYYKEESEEMGGKRV